MDVGANCQAFRFNAILVILARVSRLNPENSNAIVAFFGLAEECEGARKGNSTNRVSGKIRRNCGKKKRKGCPLVRPSVSVGLSARTSDNLHIRPIRVNMSLTVHVVNCDLPSLRRLLRGYHASQNGGRMAGRGGGSQETQ